MSGRVPALAIAGVLLLGSISGCSRPAAPVSDGAATIPTPTATAIVAPGTPTEQPVVAYPTATAPPMTPSPSAQASPAPRSDLFCEVGLPDEWKAALERGTVSIPGVWFNPMTVDGETGDLFGGLWADDWAGVARVTPGASEYLPIFAFADPANDHAGRGHFDGRWLTWVELHNPANWDDWTLRAWDSQSGRLITVAEAPQRVGSPASSGPIVWPDLSHGQLAWIQATGVEQGIGEVHLYDLAHERDQVVTSGHVAPPVLFWGPHLIWQEIDIPAQRGHLRMIDARSGQEEVLPPVLASIHQVVYVAADGEVVAWSDFQTLWAWRLGDAGPSEIFHTAEGIAMQFPTVSGGGTFISWDGTMGPWVADLRSRSAAMLTTFFGFRHAVGPYLVVVEPTAWERKSHLDFHIGVVDVRQLPPLPSCATSAPSGP